MEKARTAYCSWCFKKKKHNLVEQNKLRRNVYECTGCKKRTLKCRYCSNMAKGGKWDGELCAEHDGSIASFEKLDMQLDDILDYRELFEREKWNLKKAGTIGAFTIGSAAAIGPLALAAAPAVGGAVGSSLLGFSGIAATNAGLAAIGGGSLVAGGFGMAGGAAVIGATGAALGGTFGGVVANSYFGDIDGFQIEQVKNGEGEGILFIDGFLTEKKQNPKDWKNNLKNLYPDNPWYYVRWESQRLVNIGKVIGGSGGSAAVRAGIMKWAKMATKEGAKKIGPVGMVLTALGVANNPWTVALYKAGQTGILLADIVARTRNKYILAGHSLGARVIYYALESLATKRKRFIKDAHLLGGAVGNNKRDWEAAVGGVSGRIRNYYTANDWVLASLYKAGTLMTSAPIGRNIIEVKSRKLKNVDVSKHVEGHTKYKEVFSKYAEVSPSREYKKAANAD